MKRISLSVVVMVVVVGAVGSMAAMQPSAPGDQPLMGKSVILSVGGAEFGPSEDVRFESLGQHDYMVVPRKPDDTDAQYDLWIPLGEITRLRVFNSREDALAHQSRRAQPAAPPSAPAPPRETSAPPPTSGDVPEKYVKYAVSFIRRYDANTDGVLTEDEWQKMNIDYSSADTDKDGRITPVEMGAALVGETQRASRSRDAAAERGADASPAAGLIWQDCRTELAYLKSRVLRSKVPGGWLVLFQQLSQGMQQPSLTFYPDPQHVWDGTSLD